MLKRLSSLARYRSRLPQAKYALGVLVLVSACAQSPVKAEQSIEQEPGWREQVDAAAESALARYDLPSIQISIGLGPELTFERAYGMANLESNSPATRHTMYRTASIAKWFTATAAMVLVEDGKLDLDAPIQDYCPALPKKQWTITARHLLSHTSGIRHSYDGVDIRLDEERMRDEASGHRRYTDVVTPLETFANDPLRFQPGTDYLYSSPGYRVLSCVIEGADGGRDFRTIMNEDVFSPAGALSITEDDSTAIVPHRAGLYHRAASGRLERAAFKDVSENLGGGGYLSTASDLVRFAHAFGDGAIVSMDSIQQMGTPVTGPDGNLVGNRDLSDPTYGLGVFVVQAGPSKFFTHPGDQPGATTLLLLAPDQGVALAIMSNAEPWDEIQEFGTVILRTVLRGAAQRD